MLKIRLQRTGRKHEPTFRLVLTESTNSTKTGRIIEVLGNHDFRREKDTVINKEGVLFWIKKGAKPSETVHNLLVTHKVIEGKKINVLPKKTAIKKPEAETRVETPAPAFATEEAPKVEEVKQEEAQTLTETQVEEKKEKTPDN